MWLPQLKFADNKMRLLTKHSKWLNTNSNGSCLFRSLLKTGKSSIKQCKSLMRKFATWKKKSFAYSFTVQNCWSKRIGFKTSSGRSTQKKALQTASCAWSNKLLKRWLNSKSWASSHLNSHTLNLRKTKMYELKTCSRSLLMTQRSAKNSYSTSSSSLEKSLMIKLKSFLT